MATNGASASSAAVTTIRGARQHPFRLCMTFSSTRSSIVRNGVRVDAICSRFSGKNDSPLRALYPWKKPPNTYVDARLESSGISLPLLGNPLGLTAGRARVSVVPPPMVYDMLLLILRAARSNTLDSRGGQPRPAHPT